MARDTKDIRIGEHRPLEIVLKKTMVKKDRSSAKAGQGGISDKKRNVELYITDVSPRSDLLRRSDFTQAITVTVMGMVIVALINLLSTIGRIPLAETSLAAQAKTGFQLLTSAASDDDLSRVEEIFQKLSRAPFLNESYNGNFMLRKEEAAKHLADAGQLFVRAKKHFGQVKKSFTEAIQELHKGFSEPLMNRPEASPVLDAFHRFFDDTQDLTSDISQAYEEISQVSERMIPERYRSLFTGAREIVAQAKSDLQKILSGREAIFTLLGAAERGPHRIMLVFQNNQEIRPAGGFIGSFLLLEMHRGYVTSLNFHDVYDFDNPFTTFVEPPEELKPLTNSWALRDSNFSPDFRISGEKMAWFLEQEGGPRVDTVFAINLKTLGKLLELTGPIAIPELSAPIAAENYDTVLTYFVESKLFGSATPKYIVKYLIPELQKQIFRMASAGEKQKKLFETFSALQSEKHFLAYSRNDAIKDLFASLGVDGKAKPAKENEDYFQAAFASIGGTKSDRYVTTDVTHETFFDGEKIKNRVRIIRKHTWSKKEILQYRRLLEPFGVTEIPSYLLDIMGRGKNAVNIRIFVPEGSLAISDVAQKYDAELKKTYFSFSMTVEPGETKTAEVEYLLPFEAKNSPFFTYRLFVEPQAGMWNPVKFTKLMRTDRVIQSFPAGKLLETWLKEPASFAALIE